MFLTSENITNKHGFFTREGGVSTGEFASLNCGYGSGEDRELVTANRLIVQNKLGGKELVTARQTHSDIAIIVNGVGEFEADALVTDKPGIAIAILTADCAPILLEDRANGIVAAVHAGWRGARFGVIGSAIRAMQNMGADEITAAIGPCIQPCSYEVGQDFVDVFASEAPTNGQYFTHAQKPNHFMFDLAGYIEEKLYKNGVEKVHNLKADTLTQADKFYSFRRGTLAGTKEYGRQISGICLA